MAAEYFVTKLSPQGQLSRDLRIFERGYQVTFNLITESANLIAELGKRVHRSLYGQDSQNKVGPLLSDKSQHL